jgi:hypothetical protein
VTDSVAVPKFRRPEGALLRSGLESISRLGLDLPPGKKVRVAIAVAYEDGTASGEIGAAWLTDRGWKVDAAVSAAIEQGQRPRVVGTLQVTF